MKNLSGRAALITGGLTGQGFAIAEALAAEGANVAVGSYVGAGKGRAGDAAAYPEEDEVGRVRTTLVAKGVNIYAGNVPPFVEICLAGIAG